MIRSSRILVLAIAGSLAACGPKQDTKPAPKAPANAEQQSAAPEESEEQMEADQIIKDLAGPWEFSSLKGGAACRVEFAATPQKDSFALSKDSKCDRAFPTLRSASGWLVDSVGDIVLMNAQGESILTLTQKEDGYYVSTTPGAETYALVNQDEADFALPPPRNQIEGNWSINILGGVTQCSLQLNPTDDAASAGSAALAQPCSKPSILRNVKTFKKTGETLALLDGTGATVAAFRRGDSVTWRQSAPADGQLFLTR